MTSLMFDERRFNREVSFCRVYSLTSKEKLEKLFLQNRISYFIEWQERSFISRLFGGDKNKEKNTFTIRINEADVGRATELVQGMESVKLKKVRDDS
ncbi:MAG: hypothetical protein HFI44_13660 [Lachnospiraceae bacterium]|nr:hypothetical protein [Lachnospiraceae bacterium]GFI02470.1 hypothetical protein IMSAGC005_01300 [Lachnospiraceae bacterium]